MEKSRINTKKIIQILHLGELSREEQITAIIQSGIKVAKLLGIAEKAQWAQILQMTDLYHGQ